MCQEVKEPVAADGLFLNRCPGTLVKALADPFSQTVSPFKGGSAQNPSPRSNLPGFLSVAHESCQFELQVQNSAMVPGAQCIVAAKKFQKGQPVLICDDLLWTLSKEKTEKEGIVGIQVCVQHNKKTTMKAKAWLDDVLAGRLHWVDARAAAGPDIQTQNGANLPLHYLEMKVTFPRLGSLWP